MRIGLLSDTHLPASISDLDQLGPQVAEVLGGVDLILHAGDVVLPAVLDWCERFAPVRCALGAHDHFEDPRCAPVQVVEHAGWRLGVTHDVEAVPPSVRSVAQLQATVYGRTDLDILVAGDSHYERLEYRDGTLLIDPGSPVFPHHQRTRLGSMALIELTRDSVHAEIVTLGETPGAPNPTTPATITFERGRVLGGTIDGRTIDSPGWLPRGAPPFPVGGAPRSPH